MEKEYSKISPTALFCARIRAKHNMPFAKEIIELLDAKYHNQIEDLPNYGKSLNNKEDFVSFIEGRYFSLNDALLDIKNPFIVEIASGFSPRSLSLITRKDTFYLETDLPEIISLKEKIIKEIAKNHNIKTKRLFFSSFDPLNKDDVDKLGNFYVRYGNGKRLVIIHEGFLMYLNKNEKICLRDNIKYLFQKYAKQGLWLTPDFSRFKNSQKIRKGNENIRNIISKVTGRKFDYFASEKDVSIFLTEGDFNYKLIPNESVVKKLITNKKLKTKEILNSSKEYRVWCIYF